MLPKDSDPERLEIFKQAKRFEEDVVDVFRLLGYRTTVDYKLDDMQFDVRGELPGGLVPVHVLVECKDHAANVGQRDLREFASKVDYARDADQINYQAFLGRKATPDGALRHGTAGPRGDGRRLRRRSGVGARSRPLCGWMGALRLGGPAGAS